MMPERGDYPKTNTSQESPIDLKALKPKMARELKALLNW